MRVLILMILFFSSCVDQGVVIEDFSDRGDCGVNPYILHDSPYAQGNHLIIKVRTIKISRLNGKDLSPVVIRRTMDRLNKDYKALDISFQLAESITIKDDDAYLEGMSRYQKHASEWEELGFLNIFYYDSTANVGFAGAAVGIPSLSFCVKVKFSDKSTVSHEAGHCLGLYHTHTFQKNNKNDYTTGDFVCATKFAESPFRDYNSGYVGFVTDDCTYVGEMANLTQEEHNNNVKNIMSYSLVKCRDRFNDEQGDRIRWIINNSENHKRSIFK